MLINFLPHRKFSLLEQRKAFVQNLALACLLALLTAIGLSQLLAQQLARAEETSLQLRQELKALDAQLTSTGVLQTELKAARIREAVLQQVQTDSAQPAAWLWPLAEQVPDGLYWSSVSQDNRVVLVKGVARSSSQVFDLLSQMQRSAPWLQPPELMDMSLAAAAQQEGYPPGLNFSIRAELLAGPAEKQPGWRP
jgi:type IV pilus assembly protein PilN